MWTTELEWKIVGSFGGVIEAMVVGCPERSGTYLKQSYGEENNCN